MGLKTLRRSYDSDEELNKRSVLLCDCKGQTNTLRVGFNGKPFCEKCGNYKA